MKDPKKELNKFELSINLDSTPILYTDNINMTASDDGVVLNITQRFGPTNQVRIVARVGMSREHAKKFLENLGQLLIRTNSNVVAKKKNLN